MLATLRKSSADHHHRPVVNIERQAPYLQYTVLNSIHAHHEPNFRKQPAGWAGYTAKFADPFAPFATRSPLRHFDRTMMGLHYGAGHSSLKFSGMFYWKHAIRTSTVGFLGITLPWLMYAERMQRNGWTQKNKSATIGE